jgi:formylglycine-generating enzyme required for sulfatase activity
MYSPILSMIMGMLKGNFKDIKGKHYMYKTLSILAMMTFVFFSEVLSSVSLTGSVTGSGQTPITKAYVFLKSSPRFKATTDANGAFQISGNIPVKFCPIASSSILPYVKKGRIVFSIAQTGTDVACELMALQGAKVYFIRHESISSGIHSIPLPKIAPGFYFVRLFLGDDRFFMKTVSGMGTDIGSAMRSASNGSNNVSFLAKSASSVAIDTIVIVARGYKNTLFGINAYDQKNIAVSLSASNPWKPSGALTHEKGMVKILAKGYDFEMGQPNANIWGDTTSKAEQPIHTVQLLQDFWMDTTEVTQSDYDSLMHATYPDDYKVTHSGWDAAYGKGSAYAVYSVYWSDAALYCNARSKRDHLDTVYKYESIEGSAGQMCFLSSVSIDTSKNGYRMPTEAQWEYACKAGGDYDFYWGKNYESYPMTSSDSAEIETHAIWEKNSYDLGNLNASFGVHKVAQTIPNAYGLYDMCGNVYEWCTDYFDYYKYGLALDPVTITGGNLGAPQLMAARGGSWGSAACYLRAGNRYWYQDAKKVSYWYKFMGIRVVRPIK